MFGALAYRWLIVLGVSLALFGFGFVKGLQYAERDFLEAQLLAWEQAEKNYRRLVDHAASINERTAAREASLIDGLVAAQQKSEELEHAIRERPTITRTVVRPVNNECPVCDVVDWARFICLSNLAKRSGTPCSATAPDSPGGLDATVPSHNPDAAVPRGADPAGPGGR